MNAPRSFFVTPAPWADIAALESALRALGADSFEPARILPARRISVNVLDDAVGVKVAARTIYRADFPSGPVGGRRALAKVRGVSKVRASLDCAPEGQDLPAALRSIPPAPKPPKTRPDPASRNTVRKRWSRLVFVENSAIALAFDAIGVEPAWQADTAGSWPGGFWTLRVRNDWGAKSYCLRFFCRDRQEAERLAAQIPDVRRAK